MADPAPVPDTPADAPAVRPTKPKRSETVETLIFLVKLIVIVVVFRSFIVAPFNIPSQSMLPRLYIGDYLFVSKWNYGYSRWSLPFGMPAIPGRLFGGTPARGDVVVFRGPPGDDVDVIKRVIGLPGDTVQMRHGQIVLNGTLVPRERIADFVLPITPNYPAGSECPSEFTDRDAAAKPICRYKQFRETLPGGKAYNVLDRWDRPDADDTQVFAVPQGTVFVMGDNRDDSGDSRFPEPRDALPGQPVGMGYVPLDRIEGRALVSFFSTDGSAAWLLPWTWFSAARWSRIGEGF